MSKPHTAMAYPDHFRVFVGRLGKSNDEVTWYDGMLQYQAYEFAPRSRATLRLSSWTRSSGASFGQRWTRRGSGRRKRAILSPARSCFWHVSTVGGKSKYACILRIDPSIGSEIELQAVRSGFLDLNSLFSVWQERLSVRLLLLYSLEEMISPSGRLRYMAKPRMELGCDSDGPTSRHLSDPWRR